MPSSRVFPADVDAIITNAAGCGSALHEYPLLFAGLPEEEAARRLAGLRDGRLPCCWRSSG